jgi:hypothetical protein
MTLPAPLKHAFPANMQDFWNVSIARGLFPLAIAKGSKAPIGEGWNSWTMPIAHPGAGSIGYRCVDRGLTAFDVDVSQEPLASQLKHAFQQVLGSGIAVRRRPDSPRFLIPYFLTDAPVKGRTFEFAHGEKLQIISGQFVAFGPHAVTGQPYEWDNWSGEWPRLTSAQVLDVLARVPAMAGTSLRMHAEHETCDPAELQEATPQTQDEWQAGRDASMRYLGMLKQELMGRWEGRGSTIFAIVGVLKFGEMTGLCTREEIEGAVLDAGHTLEEGHGGRVLGEEIARHDSLPVLRGNLIMGAIMARRTLKHAFLEAQRAPTLAGRTGFELSLEDDTAELPWLLYQRILCGEVHLFTGHSGAGKSTVVTDLVYSYLTGTAWLDADVEKTGGHVLWIAAEDDYGTERRMRHLLRQHPDGLALAQRFHLIRAINEPLAFEQQCIAQTQAMDAMGKHVDAIVLDTWGASGLCFADNDTEAVLRAMFVLKLVARRTETALLITDHLPLGNEDAWQKGNGAKSGNSGFVYRVTTGRQEQISIDCGKARGAPKAKSYTGRIVSEPYGTDRKGRTTTVNVFRRENVAAAKEAEQAAPIRLAAMLPGAVAEGMDALRAGQIVKFESVSELGNKLADDEAPSHVVNRDAAFRIFGKDGLKGLCDSGYLRTMRGAPYFAVYSPMNGHIKHTLVMPWAIELPKGGGPWG